MSGSTAEACLQKASALIRQRRHLAAEEVLETAPASLLKTPQWALLLGVVHTRLGRVDRARELLMPLTHGPEPLATEGTAALADLYHFSQRPDELRQLLAGKPSWARTPRGRLFQARLLAGGDPTQALDVLLDLADGRPAELQRIAGFDAVKLLDRLGRHRQAFDLATRLHAATPAFDLGGFLSGLQIQQRLLAKGAAWCQPLAEATADLAFIVGLPRSGTTLLEQMLDCHPAVAGVGEHEGMGELADALLAAGVWPYRLSHLRPELAQAMQQQYRRSARRRAAGDEQWTLDKSLMTWCWLPALAAVLPGAVSLRLVRDPRDVAISCFLSYLDPQAFGWAASLETIRQVIAAERVLVPQALQTLQLPHEAIVYEDLVADPRAVLQRCLARLGLPMDQRVLAPENNPRTAMTLSHEQVRQPLNDGSIGRWRHYDFAFDAKWAPLAGSTMAP